MGSIDAVCRNCRKPIQWLPGTMRVCNVCAEAILKPDANVSKQAVANEVPIQIESHIEPPTEQLNIKNDAPSSGQLGS